MIVGVLIGKVAADLIFYGLAITSYEMLVRRFLQRFRRAARWPPRSRSDEPGSALVECAEDLVVATPRRP